MTSCAAASWRACGSRWGPTRRGLQQRSSSLMQRVHSTASTGSRKCTVRVRGQCPCYPYGADRSAATASPVRCTGPYGHTRTPGRLDYELVPPQHCCSAHEKKLLSTCRGTVGVHSSSILHECKNQRSHALSDACYVSVLCPRAASCVHHGATSSVSWMVRAGAGTARGRLHDGTTQGPLCCWQLHSPEQRYCDVCLRCRRGRMLPSCER